MVDKDRPVLNPVLRLNKDPKPRATTGGGKSVKDIVRTRLQDQRVNLTTQIKGLDANSTEFATFNGRSIFYASMFEDSFAPTKTPNDLFSPINGAHMLRAFRSGYLIEIETKLLKHIARTVETTKAPKELVDISRVKSLEYYTIDHVTGSRPIEQLWKEAPEESYGRRFLVWLMPMHNDDAAEKLMETFLGMRGDTILPPPPLLADVITRIDHTVPKALRRSMQIASSPDDRLGVAVRQYRRQRRGQTCVIIPDIRALQKLLASGSVFRIEPIKRISSTAPGHGAEPSRPLPKGMDGLPIVGVVDGGLTANSYFSAQAWKVPPLIPDIHADTRHGNAVASLVVQGHEWNNNLRLPVLHCRVGTVQAVPKEKAKVLCDPQEFISYLDSVMTANPETKIWNMSFNIREACDIQSVSYLGHEIAKLARKHAILPVISIGNRPTEEMQPPSDCEAAITVAGRNHNIDGTAGSDCSVSCIGPGPSNMLKPEVSQFSNVRVIGGANAQGSSYSAALISPVAAHTFARLREPSPDLVKALLIHNSDISLFNRSLGFGSPSTDPLPWECRPGYVTLHWTASLRPGAAYYWELPIPQSLRKTGVLKGKGTLTAILNPHPLVDEESGPNYFGARVEVALQVSQRAKSGVKTKNLLGTMDTVGIPEMLARDEYHKWSPVRHHHREFTRVSYDGNTMRVYARTFTRDLFAHGFAAAADTPALNVVFVLSLGTGVNEDDIYNEIRDELGAFVESSIIETDLDIEL